MGRMLRTASAGFQLYAIHCMNNDKCYFSYSSLGSYSSTLLCISRVSLLFRLGLPRALGKVESACGLVSPVEWTVGSKERQEASTGEGRVTRFTGSSGVGQELSLAG